MEEFLESPEIEINILMLSLQKGLSPEEALLTPSFQHELTKKSILEELNALLKQEKCERAKKKRKGTADDVLDKVEVNAPLVIGGRGSWNVIFAPELIEDFASNNGYGYDIVKYADLLRIIRNIFQHGHENPNAMLAAFGTPNPAPTQMMHTFFGHFQFVYMHSLSWFDKLFEPRPDGVPKLYIETYDKFENTVCNRGITNGTIKPLKTEGVITLRFESANEDAVEETIVLLANTHSCVDFYVDVIPRLVLKSSQLWKDISSDSLVIRRPKLSNDVFTDYPKPVNQTVI